MKTRQSITTMNEIIFEKRNKLYGAYELRTKYPNRLFKSFIITNSLLLLFFLFPRQKNQMLEEVIKGLDEKIYFTPEVTVEQIPKTVVDHTPPPSRTTDEFSFVPVTDTVVETDVDTTHVVDNGNLATGNLSQGSGDTNSVASTGGSLPSLGGVPMGLSSVDVIPEFPGGIDQFYEFLKRRISYTREAQREGAKGRIFVKFVIDEEGFVRNVSVIKRIGYGLDEKVENVLAESPRWKPGTVRNTPVKTEMVIPFVFSIK